MSLSNRAEPTALRNLSLAFFKTVSSARLYEDESQQYFREHPNHLLRMYQLLHPEGAAKPVCSIRLIEYFVSHYVVDNNVHYRVPTQETPLFVADSYQQYMLQHHKTFFDPCKRVRCLQMTLPNGEQFSTTVGQMLFFKWFLEERVLDYLEAHLEEVQTAFRAYSRAKQVDVQLGELISGDAPVMHTRRTRKRAHDDVPRATRRRAVSELDVESTTPPAAAPVT